MTESRAHERWQIFYHSATFLSQCLIISFKKHYMWYRIFFCKLFVLSTDFRIFCVHDLHTCMSEGFASIYIWKFHFYIQHLWLPFLVITVLFNSMIPTSLEEHGWSLGYYTGGQVHLIWLSIASLLCRIAIMFCIQHPSELCTFYFCQ